MVGGSVFRRGDGYYVAQLQVNGKRRTAYAKTKREAQRKLAEMRQRAAQDGGVAQPGTRTLDDVFDLYFDGASLRPTTKAHYEYVVRTYIAPTLGRVRLARLEPGDLQQLYRELEGPRVPSKVHRLLHRALALAVQHGWLTSNPAD